MCTKLQKNVKSKPKDALTYADHNKDGKVNLKTEMTFGPAYYTAGFDASVYGKTTKPITFTITKRLSSTGASLSTAPKARS